LLISVSVWSPVILNRTISSLVRAGVDEPSIEAVALANSAIGFPAVRAARTTADVTNKRLRENAHGHKRSLHARKSALAIWYKLLTNQLDQPPLTEALKRASILWRAAACTHNDEVQLHAFDILALDGDDLRKLPLHLRKNNLSRLLARRPEGSS